VTATTRSALDQFAAEFIRDIEHFDDVRSEDLAEAFRGFLELPPFPKLDHLRVGCRQLGIPIWSLSDGPPEVDGANFSTPVQTAILIRSDLELSRAETTLTHEVREVLENAFIRVKPGYVGRTTSDNRAMNGASDRFGGFLLMETKASHRKMVENGYDPLTFAAQTGRSLPSVMKRTQTLYSARSSLPAPVMGVWLFEAPWKLVRDGQVELNDLKLVSSSKLAGFSQRKGTAARDVFPRKPASAADFRLTTAAAADQRATAAMIREMGITRAGDFLALAEPVVRFGNTWRVLLSAVRQDGIEEMRPRLERLEAPRWLPEQRMAV
jgi:hypothetical protein